MFESRYTEAVINDVFSYHRPQPVQLPKYDNIREGAREFAKILVANTPASADDQTTAMRKLREAVMTANASIALEGKY